jgi:hypothetical protein
MEILREYNQQIQFYQENFRTVLQLVSNIPTSSSSSRNVNIPLASTTYSGNVNIPSISTTYSGNVNIPPASTTYSGNVNIPPSVNVNAPSLNVNAPSFNRGQRTNSRLFPRTRSQQSNRNVSISDLFRNNRREYNYEIIDLFDPNLLTDSLFTFVTETTTPLQMPTSEQIERSTETLSYSREQFQTQTLSDTVCPITLDEFQDGDEILKINVCGHIFKKEALQNWFRRNIICPKCRQSIL